METALAADTPVIHAELGNNRTWQRTLDVGAVDTVFAGADVIVEETFHFGRHTGVTPEPRGIIAAYDAVEQALTLYHCCQSPHRYSRCLPNR